MKNIIGTIFLEPSMDLNGNNSNPFHTIDNLDEKMGQKHESL
ncbi:MAG: hypothetical protein ACFFCS_05420 [Candidatus Hodarchaeota archaeon]